MEFARYSHIVYCDDIREETSGKVSLIGCYGADLKLPPSQLPVLIPKICAQVYAVTSISRPFQEMALKVFIDDQLIGEATVDIDAGRQPIPQDIAPKRQTTASQIVLSPLAVHSELTKLRIDVHTESEVLPGYTLTIRVPSQKADGV